MTTDTLEAPPQHIEAIQEPIQPDIDRGVLDSQIADLKRSGKSIREIVAITGKSMGWIQRSLNRTIKVQAQELGLVGPRVTREELTQKIFNAAPKALDKVIALAESADKEEVQLKASGDLLDRAGFAPVQRTISLSIVEELPREDLISEIMRIIEPRINDLPSTDTNVSTIPIVDPTSNMGECDGSAI